MEFKVTLDATPVLLALFGDFVSALRGLSVASPVQTQVVNQAMTAPAPTGIAPQVPSVATTADAQPPTAPAMPAQSQAPAQAPAAPAAPSTAPAATPTIYTPEQVNTACAPLIDAGRVSELRSILKDQFQVDSLQKLTPEQLADFVVVVRGLGAQI